MITFTKVIRINRPAADIYAYVSDLENNPEWNWAIAETTKTTQVPITVGTRYRQTRGSHNRQPKPSRSPSSTPTVTSRFRGPWPRCRPDSTTTSPRRLGYWW